MIKELEFLKKYDIDEAVVENIEQRITVNCEKKLTGLQLDFVDEERREQIFDYELPARKNKHILVQGTTSSGKTLVAELLALKYLADYKQVVYLVPLKALVTEKCRTFREHFNLQDKPNARRFKIYASSSDYQDHDKNLLEGDYDIAVVVYEKFFAMLTENPDNKFLTNCSLIVVDELQSISLPDRGPKLEFAMTRVMHGKKTQNIRIMGLTTIDCSVNYIMKWMDNENQGENVVLVQNNTRPVSLEETIIGAKDGKFRTRYISSDGSISKEYKEGIFDGFDCTLRHDLRECKTEGIKERFLMLLLSKIFRENTKSKIIVFVNSRNRCKIIAQKIAEANIIPQQNLCHVTLERELDKIEEEEKFAELKNIYAHGVAYHSAQLRMSLREAVEKAFKDVDSNIKILVATETITIGMNMPADVMIILDDQVRRSGGEVRDISLQEYRNYIGRAGRLSITNKGRSYLITKDFRDVDKKWKYYMNDKKENLVSALKDDDEEKDLIERSAAYYLNLLSMKGVFDLNDIDAWVKKTLNYQHGISLSAEKLCEKLEKNGLSYEYDDFDSDDAYKLTSFGQAMAPFALSIPTCKKIAEYFIKNGHVKKGRTIGGLPYGYQVATLKLHCDNIIEKDSNEVGIISGGQYILDIIAIICDTDEVRVFPKLNYEFKDSSMGLIQRKAIISYFDKYELRYKENAYWENSQLKKDIEEIRAFSNVGNNINVLNKVYRTVLLACWIEGLAEREIKNKLKLGKIDVFESDLGRLADICSYILEAVSKCITIDSERKKFYFDNENFDGLKKLSRAFYRLSSKVKYGLNDSSLLRIAKWQIPGIERYDLIKLAKESKRDNFDNVNIYLASGHERLKRILSQEQIDAINRRIGKEIEQLDIENLADECGNGCLDENWIEAASRLFNKKSNNILSDMKDVFKGLTRSAVTKSGCGIKYLIIKNTNKDVKDSVGEIALVPYSDNLYEILGDFVRECGDDYSNILIVVNRKDDIFSRKDVTFIEGGMLIRIVAAVIARVEKIDDDENAALALRMIMKFFEDKYGHIVYRGPASLNETIEKIMYIAGRENTQSQGRKKTLQYYKEHCGAELIHGANNRIYKFRDKLTGMEKILKEISISDARFGDKENFIGKRIDALKEYLSNADKDIKDFLKTWLLNYSDNPFVNEENIEILVKEVLDYEKYEEKKIAKATVYLSLGLTKLQEARIANEMGSRFVKVSEYSYYFDTTNSDVRVQVLLVMDKMDFSLDACDLRSNKVEVVNVGLQICDALNELHGKGYLHRDIKPSNLFKKGKEYYLGDLGSVLDMNEHGTSDYCAPEFNGTNASVPGDIFSLGWSLYKLYSGEYLDYQGLAQDKDNKDSLIRVLAKAVQEKPEDRYQSALEFKNALEKCVEER